MLILATVSFRSVYEIFFLLAAKYSSIIKNTNIGTANARRFKFILLFI